MNEPWREAASFAARVHAGQLRKDGLTPYVAHVFRVAMVVRHVFECEDPICLAAALLHDVIEDTRVDYDEVLEHFGHEIADCVSALTKDMRLVEAQREAEYDRRLARADWRARLVKLADVYDNTLDQSEPTQRMADRVRRAVALAEVDAHRAETARALAAVKVLLAGDEGGAA